MIVFSHRGLDLEKDPRAEENSLQAFSARLKTAPAETQIGIELDLQITNDGQVLVSHDPIQQGQLLSGKSSYPTLEDVASLSEQFAHSRWAWHVKGRVQTEGLLKSLGKFFSLHPSLMQRSLVFDLRPEIAAALRQKLPNLPLAASVSHAFDCTRFSALVGHTLISVEEIKNYRSLYQWLWLDEWDLQDVNRGRKALLTKSSVSSLKAMGFQLAAVSPELHRHENHPDGRNLTTLNQRWREWLSFESLDAICTDYPARLIELCSERC